jgi:hypothetical protein
MSDESVAIYPMTASFTGEFTYSSVVGDAIPFPVNVWTIHTQPTL